MSFFFFGFLGGIIRGTVGLIKYIQSYKDVTIKPWYFGGTVAISGFIGLAAAWITHDLGISFLGLEKLPLGLALIIGYAGGDFMENIFKIIIKDDKFFQMKNLLKKE
jgi:hypothetical protein